MERRIITDEEMNLGRDLIGKFLAIPRNRI